MKSALIVFASIAALGLLGLIMLLAHQGGLPVLFPSGSIAIAERDLMVRAVLLMLIVVVPVYLLIIFMAWQYRARNKKATYTPDWEQSSMEEFIWWSIPFEIVLVLGALTWTATHELDPYRALSASQSPITIEVVALPWKWLFLYPEQGVVSVNTLVLPTDRPVQFKITADAPMNSFWIPALGGQMYAMSGMVTELNLDAPRAGSYEGRSANYSGKGFAGMTFETRAMTPTDFDAWVVETSERSETFTQEVYAELALPSEQTRVRYYNGIAYPFASIVAASMGMSDKHTPPGNDPMTSHH